MDNMRQSLMTSKETYGALRNEFSVLVEILAQDNDMSTALAGEKNEVLKVVLKYLLGADKSSSGAVLNLLRRVENSTLEIAQEEFPNVNINDIPKEQLRNFVIESFERLVLLTILDTLPLNNELKQILSGKFKTGFTLKTIKTLFQHLLSGISHEEDMAAIIESMLEGNDGDLEYMLTSKFQEIVDDKESDLIDELGDRWADMIRENKDVSICELFCTCVKYSILVRIFGLCLIPTGAILFTLCLVVSILLFIINIFSCFSFFYSVEKFLLSTYFTELSWNLILVGLSTLFLPESLQGGLILSFLHITTRRQKVGAAILHKLDLHDKIDLDEHTDEMVEHIIWFLKQTGIAQHVLRNIIRAAIADPSDIEDLKANLLPGGAEQLITES